MSCTETQQSKNVFFFTSIFLYTLYTIPSAIIYKFEGVTVDSQPLYLCLSNFECLLLELNALPFAGVILAGAIFLTITKTLSNDFKFQILLSTKQRYVSDPCLIFLIYIDSTTTKHTTTLIDVQQLHTRLDKQTNQPRQSHCVKGNKSLSVYIADLVVMCFLPCCDSFK